MAVVPPVTPTPTGLSNTAVTDEEMGEVAGAVDPDDDMPTLNDDQLMRLGAKLSGDFDRYKMDRRQLEMQWEKNFRQYRGIYDSEAQIDPMRSHAYPKLTRVKCVSMVSRLMNLLFPSNEKNWTILPSPVPNLTQEDLQSVLDGLTAKSQGAPITDEQVTDAVKEFATDRARNLETEIEDQLTELGGARNVSYLSLCRRAMMSGVQYGAGVVKGPAARQRQQRRWTIGTDGKINVVDEKILVPEFEFVPIWDYYPDLSAKYLHQMDGQFQRIVMSRQQVRMLAENPDFFGDKVKKYLATHVKGNYKETQFETSLRAMGDVDAKPRNQENKYEVILWDGALSGSDIKDCGIVVGPDQMSDMFNVVVWFIDRDVIRAKLSPWMTVGETAQINSYHTFIFEEDESNLLGIGLPQIMRDSQMAVAACARMILDNASVVCGTNLEVNDQLLTPGQDVTSVAAYKIWHRDDESPTTAGIPAVRPIEIESHLAELQTISAMFTAFADQETFVSPATGGDMQKGPSEPFRTAAGASMLQGLMALPFKDAVRGFDSFTESVMNSLVMFNKYFNTKDSIKGDFQPVARGSTSLIAKEVRGMGLDNLVSTLRPEEALYIDTQKLLRERLIVRDINPGEVMVSDAEATSREQAKSQADQAHQQSQDQLLMAQVKKLLADAVKSLTQSDKNTSNAQMQTYNAITDGLHKGVTPQDAADAKAGIGGVPDAVPNMKAIEHPVVQPPMPPQVPDTDGDNA